ncbi:RluA family pseudouridine synthase [Lachnospiraceae bacterium 38-14]|uniref:RluA family pseudouridine synthase n=1 Tax=Roseburia sp. 1XD42-69 TaxID=2320088 RepID=UPI000EA2327D|nr:RluA family pseudouridine synthase [Roseburia sp. 1XD42-69]RKJ68515.1 RluA family pseudouridine synthase [Roseburia sp. 1XD42-69]
MREILIEKNQAGQRFDKYLKKLLCGANSSFIYKMLRKKNIVLNGKKSEGAEKLKEGDKVTLFFSQETFEKFTASETESFRIQNLPKVKKDKLPFQVLYETRDILIINKPSGMLSQKGEKGDISANEYILSYLLLTGSIRETEFATFRPSVCNRLDRNTSGILIAGKTLKGLQEMSENLKNRSLKKYYYALVKGEVSGRCRLKGYLIKDEKTNRVYVSKKPDTGQEKPIETEYEPIITKNQATLLNIHLITGRSHQIRAHLSATGHPIIGDPKYGDREVNERYKKQYQITSQLLHARSLILEDGREIIAPLPKDFTRILGEENGIWQPGIPEV